MLISEIISYVDGTLLSPCQDLETDIKGGFAGDLMSDVLASIQSESVLITGLSNPQVVRTALIADVRLIIFGRGKKPGKDTINLAIAEQLPIVTSKLGLYEISARLASHGLPSCEIPMDRPFDPA
ncbi:MAG TPA: DRTGG domain-containing protein [Anaerolineaceae bacterium]|nr:DRTGG domain-containing protein [Anaerolineaceae bacterium]